MNCNQNTVSLDIYKDVVDLYSVIAVLSGILIAFLPVPFGISVAQNIQSDIIISKLIDRYFINIQNNKINEALEIIDDDNDKTIDFGFRMLMSLQYNGFFDEQLKRIFRLAKRNRINNLAFPEDHNVEGKEY